MLYRIWSPWHHLQCKIQLQLQKAPTAGTAVGAAPAATPTTIQAVIAPQALVGPQAPAQCALRQATQDSTEGYGNRNLLQMMMQKIYQRMI